MSIILLLLLFLIWMSCSPDAGAAVPSIGNWGTPLFLVVYVILIMAVAVLVRRRLRLAFNRGSMNLLRGGGRTMALAHWFIPGWFTVGILFLGWAPMVHMLLGPLAHYDAEFPGLVLGILPPMLTWVGLWWAHYPAYRAIREQNLLVQLDADMPLYAPPTLGEYISSKFRMQLLFTSVPIFMIVGLRDVAMLTLKHVHRGESSATVELGISVGALAVVFLIAPEVLRRILSTEPLPDTQLRRQLAAIAQRDGVGCRDVLLWRTHHTVGNAAVMGMMRWVRYVMLSDLLLESLPDEQVAAVFAHEVGHVIHKHILWYALLMIGLSLGFVGLESALDSAAYMVNLQTAIVSQVFPFVSIALFIMCFGFVSRRFERQADVHAARTMQAMADGSASGLPTVPTHVGQRGAAIFSGALLRISEVNNIPPEARGHFSGTLRQRLSFAAEWIGTAAASWIHGTIASRVRYITQISADPALTFRFDRQMIRLRVVLAIAMVLCAVWAGVDLSRQHDAGATETPRAHTRSGQQSPASVDLLP